MGNIKIKTQPTHPKKIRSQQWLTSLPALLSPDPASGRPLLLPPRRSEGGPTAPVGTGPTTMAPDTTADTDMALPGPTPPATMVAMADTHTTAAMAPDGVPATGEDTASADTEVMASEDLTSFDQIRTSTTPLKHEMMCCDIL